MLPKTVCKRIRYFMGDEKKATGEYRRFKRTLQKASKSGKFKVLGTMSRQEAHHRRNLAKIYNANCR